MDGRYVRKLCLAGAMFGLAGGAAAQEGYVTSSTGEIVTNSFGDCVTTSTWEPSMAVPQCHPELAALEEVQAVQPEPRRVTRLINLEADANFDFDEATLTEEGKRKLDEIVATLRDAQDPRIQLVGYTDRIGPEEYNQQLSEERARAVRDYLVERGVPGGAIQLAARGESNPVVSCEGISGNALIECLRPNRRTEVELSAFEVVEEPAGEAQQPGAQPQGAPERQGM